MKKFLSVEDAYNKLNPSPKPFETGMILTADWGNFNGFTKNNRVKRERGRFGHFRSAKVFYTREELHAAERELFSRKNLTEVERYDYARYLVALIMFCIENNNAFYDKEEILMSLPFIFHKTIDLDTWRGLEKLDPESLGFEYYTALHDCLAGKGRVMTQVSLDDITFIE